MPATTPICPPINDSSAVADFYQEYGYYIGRGLVDASALAVLERDFDRIAEQIQAGGANANARWNQVTTTAIDQDIETVVIHTHQVEKFSAAWAKWLMEGRYLDVIEALIGPDIILHHSKLFLKPAGRGAPFPPHQDFGYFRTLCHSMMAATAFLSEANESNGCLRVWPGSHKIGPIDPKVSMGGNEEFFARFPFADSIPAEVQPGDLVFFNYLTVHGSFPNRSARSRKSVLIQVYSGRDAMQVNGGYPSSNLVLRGWNHLMTRTLAENSRKQE